MNNNNTLSPTAQLLTVKSLLVPLLTRPKVAHFIKYMVYISLLINTGFYLLDDYQALFAAIPDDAPLMDILTRFSTSVDMVAWVMLIVLFELETYALPDEAFTKKITAFLLGGRVICYILIVFAAYGYTVEALNTYDYSEVDGVTDTCQLAGGGEWLQINSIDYEEITPENCESLSDDSLFYQLEGESSVLGESLLGHIQRQGWLDISNAIIWIIVVVLIEIEVWLQGADRFGSRLLPVVRVSKTLFYLVLIFNGFAWALTGYALYAWDAFLWIFGFWAIELNLAEWEQDRLEELRAEQVAAPA